MLENFFINQPPENAETGSYQLLLVVLSYAVASFASYTALSLGQLLVRQQTPQGKLLAHWGGAFAMGAGIWSMHFVGMLAFKMDMGVSYDPWLTILSMLVAVAVAYGVLAIISRPRLPVWRVLVGAVLLGFGI